MVGKLGADGREMHWVGPVGGLLAQYYDSIREMVWEKKNMKKKMY